MSLTLYLAKEGVDSPEGLLRNVNELDRETLTVGDKLVGELFILKRVPRPPSWASFFEGSSVEPRSLGSTQSAGAILLVTVGERVVAVTFGTSYHYLRNDQLEERFGLLVVANSIDENRLRGLVKQTFDAISKKSREQSVREAETREFGLDIEQDLLRGLTGVPTNQRLGSLLTGKDSLRAIGSFELRSLPDQLHRYLERFQDTAYRQRFQWIDNIREVKSPELRDALDDLLEERIQSREWDNIWLAAPDIIDWERTAGFSYRFGRRKSVIYDMHLKTVEEQLPDGTLTVPRLRQRYVQALSLDDTVIEQWSVYRCIHAEIEHQGDIYLLSNGRWYRAAIDFVARVNEATERVPLVDLDLPAFSDTLEDEYNRRVARDHPDKFTLLHEKLVPYGGGRSSVEPCDLFSSAGDFVHVKRYAGSSDLSHLFAQGVISGEIFARDREFREAVFGMLPERNRPAAIPLFLPRSSFRVVFAVISRSGKELRLPFFARLNLKRAREILVSLGYEVALTDIPVSAERKLLSRSRKVSKTF